MTKGLISQIESGKTRPSIRTLSIIAQRLDRPLTYFLDEGEQDVSLVTLIQQARTFLHEQRYTQALTVGELALKKAEASGSDIDVMRAYMLCGQALFRSGRYDEALERFDEVYERAFGARKRSVLVEALYWRAGCSFALGRFRSALKLYQRCIQKGAGMKKMAATCDRAQLYMGTTAERLGQLDTAVAAFDAVYRSAKASNQTGLLIDAALSLSWALHRQGDNARALEISKQALDASLRNKCYALERIFHNRAVYLEAVGRTDEAERLRRQALRDLNRPGNERFLIIANVDVAALHLNRGELQKARDVIEDSLDRLAMMDEPMLRGQYYRLLGQVEASAGDPERAGHWYQLAMECFRSVQARHEMKATSELMQTSE